MLAKTFLVVYLFTARSSVQIQYVVQYATEQQCMQQAAKMQPKGAWNAFPVQYAECVMDVTKR